MSDYCLVCGCEPIEKDGWFVNDELECLCPWCFKDMKRNKEVYEKVKYFTKENPKRFVGDRENIVPEFCRYILK